LPALFSDPSLSGCVSSTIKDYNFILYGTNSTGTYSFFNSTPQFYMPSSGLYYKTTTTYPYLTTKFTETGRFWKFDLTSNTSSEIGNFSLGTLQNSFTSIAFYCRTATTTLAKSWGWDTAGTIGFTPPLLFIAGSSTSVLNTTSTAYLMDYSIAWPAAILIFLVTIILWLLLFRR